MFLRFVDGVIVGVGEVVCFGLFYLCMVFDKWWVVVVFDDLDVVDFCVIGVVVICF